MFSDLRFHLIYASNQINMKKTILFLSLAVVLFSSCQNTDDNSNTAINTTTVSNTITTGSWRVTYYWDTDHEETSSFSGYSFVFGSGNVLTATKNGTAVTGTWSTLLDDSLTKLVLNFATPADFEEISDDWHVVERTATKIRLQDVSGGNGGTDYLTFERN